MCIRGQSYCLCIGVTCLGVPGSALIELAAGQGGGLGEAKGRFVRVNGELLLFRFFLFLFVTKSA